MLPGPRPVEGARSQRRGMGVAPALEVPSTGTAPLGPLSGPAPGTAAGRSSITGGPARRARIPLGQWGRCGGAT